MAFTSTKMGLRVWNLLTDLYDHTQLADNWAKVDYHDHSPGKGVQIPTEGIADGAITGVKLTSSLDPSGAYLSAKSLFRAGGQLAGGATAGTYVLFNTFGTITSVPASPASQAAVYLDPDLWASTGRVVRYSLRATVITNAVAPTATYAFSLFPVATWGGASGSAPTVATLGAAVSGSTTANIVAPGAAAPATPVMVEFDAPTAGWYSLAVVQTGAAAAGANVSFVSSLFAKQV